MKSSTYVLDTSFISALLVEDDGNYLKAKNIFAELPDAYSVIIPRTVELELLVGVAQEIIEPISFYNLWQYLKVILVDIDANFIEEYSHFLTKNKLRLKPIDSSVVFLAIKENAQLLTFDYKLETVYNKLLSN